MKRVVWIAVVAVAVVVIIRMTMDGGSQALPEYRTARVMEGDIETLVSATGTVRAITLVPVGSQVSGRIKEILVEMLVLSFMGGIIGIAVGLTGSQAVGALAGWPIMYTPWAIAFAFIFSALVGVFFGFYPAQRASRLDPIRCLRYE